LAAREAGVAAPKCWLIEGAEDLKRIASEIVYPCVLKPLAAHHWRQGDNWELVGARKAIGIASETELEAEYDRIARADKRALLQEMVSGSDDCLLIVACYLDQKSRWVAAFNTRKVLQIPEGFGTGCIVQSVSRPTLFDTTRRLLEGMCYSGIAEVEYKWDAAAGEYKLIEVNPRPWDQHRLGKAAGVDLIYMAYCEHTGRSMPEPAKTVLEYKWIAEDTFVTAAIRSLRGGRTKLGGLIRLARGKRIYAIWLARDPLPAAVYWVTFIPVLIGAGTRALWFALKNKLLGNGNLQKGELVYEAHVEKPESLR
jgi:predicted ATP-grasp superfamily ATP-dependent carboligase